MTALCERDHHSAADWCLSDYLDRLASDLPAPGGGSAAALVGALAAALGSMVANFTVGREKFAAVDADMRAALASLEVARAAMTDLAQADMTAYEGVKAAYRLAKDDPARPAAIQDALKHSASVPMKVLAHAATIARLLGSLAANGNPNLISDVGVAAVFADAAAAAAHLNVDVNLALIDDADFVDHASADASAFRSEITELCAAALSATLSAIHGSK
jgi:formiminotetrahydrofolate cyclodeaminase